MRVDFTTYAHLREIMWGDERRHLDLIKALITRPYSNWHKHAVVTRKLKRVTGHLQPRWTATLGRFDEDATITMETTANEHRPV